jgi:outer membrane protein TolC
VQASRHDLAQSVSLATFDVVSAYWSYLSAQRTRAIAADAEAGAQTRAADVERLIAADRLPAAERDLVTADVASKRSNRISAEQALLEARSALGRAIGLEAGESFALPPPGDEYPEAGPAAADVLNRLPALRDAAREHREDLRAADLRVEQARMLLEAFRANLRPQLDLNLSLGSSGLIEGSASSDYWSALSTRLRGPNVGVSLSYQFAVGNNVAAGQLAQRISTHEQATIRRRDLRDAVLTEVETLAHAVRRLGIQLAEARSAVALFARSVENEETRRQLGTGTLIDVINVSDRLLQARLSLDSAQLGYALAVARLRLATGTLTRLDSADPAAMKIDSASLTQVPR